jgi:hypothetical protein
LEGEPKSLQGEQRGARLRFPGEVLQWLMDLVPYPVPANRAQVCVACRYYDCWCFYWPDGNINKNNTRARDAGRAGGGGGGGGAAGRGGGQ